MPGIPFSFDEALWSDPLGLVPGALPASPPSAGHGNTALLQAAAMSGIASHAALVAGQWPTASGSGPGQAIPAALPVSAAALLQVRAGDVLRLRDTISHALVSFDITGVFAPRHGAGPADSYWKLSYIPVSGRSASYGSTTYGPLVVSQAAFGLDAHAAERVVGSAARRDERSRRRPQSGVGERRRPRRSRCRTRAP